MKVKGYDLDLTGAHDRLMAQLPEFWRLVFRIWPPSIGMIIGIDVARQGSDQTCVMVNHIPTSKCEITGSHDHRLCKIYKKEGSYATI